MKVHRQDVSEFGRRLRLLRKERGLSMDALCEQYNREKGQHLNKSTVSRWENNTQEPLISTVAALASFFGVSPLWLLGDSEDRNCTVAEVILSGSFSAPPISRDDVPNDESASDEALPAPSSPEGAELLRIFESLSVRGRTRLLSFAYELEEGSKDE